MLRLQNRLDKVKHNCEQMERCGQYNTAHHEEKRRLKAEIERQSAKPKRMTYKEDNN